MDSLTYQIYRINKMLKHKEILDKEHVNLLSNKLKGLMKKYDKLHKGELRYDGTVI